MINHSWVTNSGNGMGVHGPSIARRRHLRASLSSLLRALRTGRAAGAALHLAAAETRQPASRRWACGKWEESKEQKAIFKGFYLFCCGLRMIIMGYLHIDGKIKGF